MVTTKPEFDFVFRIKKERYLVMSYLNNQLGYRDALLDTRSIIKKGDYIVLDPDGLVKNVVPGYENCDVTILGSPARVQHLLIILYMFTKVERIQESVERESSPSYM